MNLNMRTVVCLALAVVFSVPTASLLQADEPTWLFTIPKAESLGRDYYNIGFIHADFGVTEDLEIGILGLKYSMSEHNLGFGVSLIPMASPYLVTSQDIGSAKLHIGLKAAPYVFFAGVEIPASDEVKLVAGITNGVTAGVRIFPAENWTLDVFAAFITVETYKYRYGRVQIDDFFPLPAIFVAYSGRL